MESNRQKKFAGLLQEELASLFQREGSSYLPNTLVTITKVRISPDLAVAKVYVSFFNTSDKLNSINLINAHANELRYKLGTRIRHQVRVIPSLSFFIDDTNEYVERMDQLFDEIAKDNSAAASNEDE